MEKDTKFIVGAIIILVVMIVSFNVNITGFASSANTGSSLGKNIALPKYGLLNNVVIYGNEKSFLVRIGSNDGDTRTGIGCYSSTKYDSFPKEGTCSQKIIFKNDVAVDKIRLIAKTVKGAGWVKKGKLTFSDGSVIENIEVPYGRSAPQGTLLEFPAKTIKWVKFDVQQGYGTDVSIGEFEVYSSSATFSGIPIKSCSADVKYVDASGASLARTLKRTVSCSPAIDDSDTTAFYEKNAYYIKATFKLDTLSDIGTMKIKPYNRLFNFKADFYNGAQLVYTSDIKSIGKNLDINVWNTINLPSTIKADSVVVYGEGENGKHDVGIWELGLY